MTVVIRLLALRPGHAQLLPACAKLGYIHPMFLLQTVMIILVWGSKMYRALSCTQYSVTISWQAL